MKRKQFSEEQIIKVAEGEAGATGKEVCRRQSFYRWKSKYGGRVRGQAAEAGSGEPKSVAGRTPGQRGTEGAVIKKLVRPAAKREASIWSIGACAVSGGPPIWLVCIDL